MIEPPFNDPALVARYVADTPSRVPGLGDLHRMAQMLLAERAPEKARILVLGAGGGLELKAFAALRPDWSFVGVDPSQPMLDLAQQVLGPLGSRVELVNGRAEDAPPGPFDGACCLLTLHFLSSDERLGTLCALKGRLKAGTAFVMAHHSDPGDGPVENWLKRSATFAAGPEADASAAAAAAATMSERLTLLAADKEQALLREAGFTSRALFYAALSFRGWVAYSGSA